MWVLLIDDEPFYFKLIGKPLGQFRPTGLRPMFAPKLEAMGYRLDRAMFMNR